MRRELPALLRISSKLCTSCTVPDQFLVHQQHQHPLQFPAMHVNGTAPESMISPAQGLTSPSASAGYPRYYGGGAQAPPRDAEFEAWHGPVRVVPPQQQQRHRGQRQHDQQQQHQFAAQSNPLPAPPAGALGMPELPFPEGLQVSLMVFTL